MFTLMGSLMIHWQAVGTLRIPVNTEGSLAIISHQWVYSIVALGVNYVGLVKGSRDISYGVT